MLKAIQELLSNSAIASTSLDSSQYGIGVAIAIIDTGIDTDLLHIRHRNTCQSILPIRTYTVHANFAEVIKSNHVSSLHGTTVCDIILSLAANIQVFSVNIFDFDNTCNIDRLITAIEFATHHWPIQLMNLSLGVPEHQMQNMSKRQKLFRVIEDAYLHNITVFASANNDHPLFKSYPSLFTSSLISVDKDRFDDPLHFSYLLNERIEFRASSHGHIGPYANEPTTSWATPHLAGIAARLLTLKPDLKPFEIKTLLYWLSRRPEVASPTSP